MATTRMLCCKGQLQAAGAGAGETRAGPSNTVKQWNRMEGFGDMRVIVQLRRAIAVKQCRLFRAHEF